MENNVSDIEKFGKGIWIYCKQHHTPHLTGWCTVRNEEKILLNATTYDDAIKECKQKGYDVK